VPTRDFLDDERGVTLLLRNVLTGVVKSSLATESPFGVFPVSLLSGRRGREVFVEVADAARRGVMGVFAVLFVARVGIKGRLLLTLYLSVGILNVAGVYLESRRILVGDRDHLLGRQWVQIGVEGGC
jgi:hypothetical protein